MGLLDGTRSAWTEDEIRHVANVPSHWLANGRDIKATADFIDDAIRHPILEHYKRKMLATFEASLEAQRMVPSMTLLYGFALENAFKAAVICDDSAFDYTAKEVQGSNSRWTGFLRLQSHDLVSLYKKIERPVPLEVHEEQILADLSTIIVAQGRYPAGNPKSPEKNLVIYYDPGLRGFVDRLFRSIEEYVQATETSRSPSPLGRTIAYFGDYEVEMRKLLAGAGYKVFQSNGLDPALEDSQ